MSSTPLSLHLKGSPVYTLHASLHAEYTVMEAIAGLAAKGNGAMTIAGGSSMPGSRGFGLNSDTTNLSDLERPQIG